MYSGIEEKREQPQKQISINKEICRWCDSILSPVTIKSVCLSCYKLLLGANLPDEEIFGGQKHWTNVYK